MPSNAVESYGVLLYRLDPLSVYLIRPGGPLYAGRPRSFGIPKGKIDPGESGLECAYRELAEEVGLVLDPAQGEYLGYVIEKHFDDKKIHAFMHRYDGEVHFKPNMLTRTHDGVEHTFPEMEDGQWFEVGEARKEIRPSQEGLLDMLGARTATNEHGRLPCVEFSLFENMQQADKLYFRPGTLDDKDKEVLLDVTAGDAYSRLAADWMYHLKNFIYSNNKDKLYTEGIKFFLAPFHRMLKEYDSSVFPVAGKLEDYGGSDAERGWHVIDLFSMLKNREEAVSELRKLPSLAVRNLAKDVRMPRNDSYYFKDVANDLRSIDRWMPTINKSRHKDKLLRKIFSSKNDIKAAAKNAEHFGFGFNIDTEDMNRESLMGIVDHLDLEVVQDDGNILSIRVDSQSDMEEIGRASMWCFARPDEEEYWETYATNGHVYVIFDFGLDTDDANFMMVYLPDTGAVYSSMNMPLEETGIDNDGDYLRRRGVDTSVLN